MPYGDELVVVNNPYDTNWLQGELNVLVCNLNFININCVLTYSHSA